MKKTFDCVKFQREARAKLSEAYVKDPEGFMKELDRKYGHWSTKKKAEKKAEKKAGKKA